MKAFFHPSQDQHLPKTYFTRGQMRQPQEIPDRTAQMLEGLKAMGIPVLQPADQGAGAISKVHDLGYLRFLESAHRRWSKMEDWGDEVISNIFVRSPNALKGILAEAARYQADGSCPIGANTWDAAYWSAQTALGAADALVAGERHAWRSSRSGSTTLCRQGAATSSNARVRSGLHATPRTSSQAAQISTQTSAP